MSNTKPASKLAKNTFLKVKIQDFGPITNGTISIKPLTILIGPNNSGKSYTAMLIYSLLQCHSLNKRALGSTRTYYSLFQFNKSKEFFYKFPQLKKDIGNLFEQNRFIIPIYILDKISNFISDAIYRERLVSEIERSFGSTLNELIRQGADSFSLEMSANSYDVKLRYENNILQIEKYPKLHNTKLIFELDRALGDSTVSYPKYEQNKILTKYGKDATSEIELLIYQIMSTYADLVNHNVSTPSYYLPASRSGILQVYKVLASGIIQNMPYAGRGGFEIPELSGVVSDLLSQIINLPNKEGPLDGLASDFEQELTRGSIVLESRQQPSTSNIKYQINNLRLPLYRASSTVSELAPLILYLRYILASGDMLIIEEPESHLHPNNQIILAKFIVRLIRKGMKVMLTTHSQFLIEQLSNFILLSKIDRQALKRRYGYETDDYITVKEISTHRFEYDENKRGFNISEVPMTDEDGISQDEFMKIHEILYDETIKVHRDIGI